MTIKQPLLPGFENAVIEAEAQTKEMGVPPEASERHTRSVALRWFGYYKKSNDPNKRFDIIRQYNMIATMRQRI